MSITRRILLTAAILVIVALAIAGCNRHQQSLNDTARLEFEATYAGGKAQNPTATSETLMGFACKWTREKVQSEASFYGSHGYTAADIRRMINNAMASVGCLRR